MTKLSIIKITLLLFIVILCSCDNEQKYKKVANTPSWNIYELNSNTILCVPLYNSDKGVSPIILNKNQYEINKTNF